MSTDTGIAATTGVGRCMNPSLEHLMNWRLYRESSGGLLEELGSHHIDIANWVFGEQPQTLLGSSSIAVYHDGRTVGDNVQAVLGYSKDAACFSVPSPTMN